MTKHTTTNEAGGVRHEDAKANQAKAIEATETQNVPAAPLTITGHVESQLGNHTFLVADTEGLDKQYLPIHGRANETRFVIRGVDLGELFLGQLFELVIRRPGARRGVNAEPGVDSRTLHAQEPAAFPPRMHPGPEPQSAPTTEDAAFLGDASLGQTKPDSNRPETEATTDRDPDKKFAGRVDGLTGEKGKPPAKDPADAGDPLKERKENEAKAKPKKGK
jgi:hypothetical protein